MKIFLFLPLYLLGICHLKAQPSLLDKKGTLHLEEKPLKEALRKVEAAYQVSFSYFNLPVEETSVSLQVQNQPLHEALGQLLSRTSLTYEITGSQVILKEVPSPQPSYLHLNGKVLDQQTQVPLPYASVALKGKPIGTVTNQAGEFTFHLSDRYMADTLLISFVGYEPYRERVQKLVSQPVATIQLSPSTIVLGEVVVSDALLTAEEIVQTAIARIGENYPTEPCWMEGFYRDWAKSQMREDYVKEFGLPQTASLLEAAVGVYDEGYGKRGGRKVYVQEIRKSQELPGEWHVPKGLDLGLGGDFVKNNRAAGNTDMVQAVLNFPNQMNYEILDTVIHNEESLYLIQVKALPEKKYEGGVPNSYYQLYISQQDYAILQIDLKITPGGNDPVKQTGLVKHRRVAEKKDSTFWICTMIDNTLRFRRYNGKAYLSYLRTHYKTSQVNQPSEKPLMGHEFFKELLINNLVTERVEERRQQAGTPVRQHLPVAKQLKPYNPDFWQHYNIIQDNPLDAELIELLQQQKALEKQFRESSSAQAPSAKRKPKRP